MNKDNEKRPADWWRGAFFYQTYPRSFDKDLKGITQRLDYIASLGVDGIWICPFFKSPMKDFGYDVSDYHAIDPMFGNMNDFDTLIEEAHKRDIAIIIDLVLSHTSIEHPWFKEKPEYYVWADPKPDMFGERVPPNNWVSVFGGSAWTYDEKREQYYLHNFLPEQPDLNFHNPDVQNAALDIAQFWLEKGIDGLRLDVVNFYFHDQELRDNPPRDKDLDAATQFEGDDPYSNFNHIYDKSRPESLEFIERLQTLVDQHGAFTLGEIGDDHPYERAAEYSAPGRLNTTYNPSFMSGQHKSLTANLIREPFEHFQDAGPNCWPSWAFSNHDVVRAASRWLPNGNGFDHDPKFSKLLIALLGCLHGTVFLYQGEELGLPEAKLNVEDLQDPWGKNLWPEWQGRDGCRTPIPWDDKTLGQNHWLPIPETHHALTVEEQEKDPESVLNFTRDFIAWRKTQKPLTHGNINFLETGLPTLLAFTRTTEDETALCLFSLSNKNVEIEFLDETLGPYEFFVDDGSES